jgi:two-component system, cell cycle sensor histidine kinase and response regulator CckA
MTSTDATNINELFRERSVNNHSIHSILVMDDEKSIRDVTASMLKYLGYEVTTCANGEDAIELYRNAKESGTPYLAVIMDLIIYGGMGGEDAAKQILHIDSNAKLIVSSGYLENPAMVDHQSFGFCGSLPKPYKSSDLAEALAPLHSL